MLKRVVSRYSHLLPYDLIEEQEVFPDVGQMRLLFDVDDDLDMICVYKISTPEQIQFFKNLGADLSREGYHYVECYED